MRIISGKFKGRTIKFPKSKLVRPTTDRVKESIFNYLNNLIDFENIKVCDIYAGSGSLGLEALSRGAAIAHFVEKDFFVSKVLKENIESLGMVDCTQVFRMDALRFSSQSWHEVYDLILADPPFFKDDIHKVVKKIMTNQFLSDTGIMIVERSVQTYDKDKVEFACEPIKKVGDSLIYQFTFR
ncbi:16S rRNA (guanine(966)-N(2))-methyltransferase RsmD [Melioribacter sp. OK-6-Me]|uniref:16S rRNA (guanine(966)-N(2))-methyltransferase RsmD n=1 Tax=unclassified Melioribacter TaxID=2627329 RepID=UPI003EDA0756